jgi:hypothetical protein
MGLTLLRSLIGTYTTPDLAKAYSNLLSKPGTSSTIAWNQVVQTYLSRAMIDITDNDKKFIKNLLTPCPDKRLSLYSKNPSVHAVQGCILPESIEDLFSPIIDFFSVPFNNVVDKVKDFIGMSDSLAHTNQSTHSNRTKSASSHDVQYIRAYVRLSDGKIIEKLTNCYHA